MLAKDIRRYVISPTLHILDLWSEAAEILVYGTGKFETNFNYLMQEGSPVGGGIGFYQMQPKTFIDHRQWICNNRNFKLEQSITASCYYNILPTDPYTLISNIRLATIMCRIHYFRVPEKLPAADDIEGLANYYKTYYNTKLGKAKIEDVIAVFKEIATNG